MLHVYHLESRFSALIDEGPILFFCKHVGSLLLDLLAAWRVNIT